MTSSRVSLRSSIELVPGELPAGSEVAGFRIERAVGRGSRGVVYAATQIGLERRVALKLLAADPALDDRFRRFQWPEHPHVVRLYAAGAHERGHFLAMQLVAGATLADRLAAGTLERGRLLGVLTDVACALDAAHGAGIVHGAVNARNVFIGPDERALVSDFGLGSEHAGAESDRAAFAALVDECLGPMLPAPADPLAPTALTIAQSAAAALPHAPAGVRATGSARRPMAVLAAVALAGLATVVVAVVPGTDRDSPGIAPLVRGADVLGSALSPAGMRSLDCNGRPPTEASQQCMLVQTRLPGRALGASRAGAVRRWAVRGARGEMALQILRPRGRTLDPIARTPFVRIADPGVHVLAANLPVRAGDLVGLRLAPGATIGMRRTVNGATTTRLFGSLLRSTGRVQRGAGSGLDHEILLRVAYVPGARVSSPGLLTGPAAERAPAGRSLAARDVEPRPGQLRTVALVAVGDRIAIDLLDGARRVARLPVADANPRGRLLGVDSFGEPRVRLRWRNPDGDVVSHDYAVGARSLAPMS